MDIIGISGNGNVAVSMATKAQIRRIKKEFWNIDRPTDVISFRYKELKGNVFAEVIICPEIAIERASDYGNGVEFEMVLYIVHGFLHIAGLNDSSRAEKINMRKKEEYTMKKLAKAFPELINFKKEIR
ncbi:MAG TPA: rRNA maturation RNase YbeY [Victivallales bacterium]|nr:rRNA maturation RNase YbeY [Victivallales bacterium]